MRFRGLKSKTVLQIRFYTINAIKSLSIQVSRVSSNVASIPISFQIQNGRILSFPSHASSRVLVL